MSLRSRTSTWAAAAWCSRHLPGLVDLGTVAFPEQPAVDDLAHDKRYEEDRRQHGDDRQSEDREQQENLAKQLTSRSLPEIGRKFGNRDHTTVMHAVSRVTELMERDGTFAEDVELLRRLLEA